MEKPGEKERVRGGNVGSDRRNNEEGESELKARKPCVGKQSRGREENGREKRSEKIVEDEKKRGALSEGQREISALVNERGRNAPRCKERERREERDLFIIPQRTSLVKERCGQTGHI